MKVLFLQPPMGGWVTWGKHIAINVNHAQLTANLREWYPEIEIKVLDCRALNFSETQMICLLYTSPSPRDAHESRMPSSA